MSLSETSMIDRVDVHRGDWPTISVRSVTVVMRDGEEIARTQHRHVLTPDADFTGEDATVQAVAAAVFTDDAKAAYAAAQSQIVT